MSNWPMRPLGDVAEIIRGVTFDKSQVSTAVDKGLVPVLRAGNIQGELLTSQDLVYVPRSLVSEPQLMRSGDMAICMSSGSSTIVGKSARLAYDWYGSVGAFCAIVRFNTALDSRYGSYWFKSDSFKTWRNANAKGANIQNLRRADLERIPIPVPPLAEQERIVRLLDEADAIRKLRAQADQRTADLIPALFHDMFGDPVTNPMGWPVQPLSEVIVGLQGGKNVNPAAEGEPGGQYRVLKVSAVTSGTFAATESKPVPTDYDPPEPHFVRRGDVLFSRANTTELVGATCYVPDEPVDLLLPDKIWRLVWKSESAVDPTFVLHLLQSRPIRTELSKRASGTGGSMKNIPSPSCFRCLFLYHLCPFNWSSLRGCPRFAACRNSRRRAETLVWRHSRRF